MGGDGGVIASQRKYIRGAKDPDAVEETRHVKQQQATRSQNCAQSSEKLSEPIVACELGYLYNKESVLTGLIERTLNPQFSHIRGLKDVKELVLCPNPNYSSANEAEGDSSSKFICPITLTELNGILPFVVIWTSGLVLSEKAVREIGIAGLQSDYGPFDALDVIRLLPLEEDLDTQRVQMTERRIRSKKEHKANKRLHSAKDANSQSFDEVAQKKRMKSEKKMSAKNEPSASGVTSLTSSSALVKSASEAVHGQESSSSVFKKLFHKDHEQDKFDRDLFMSVAGLRYTIS